MVTGSFPTPWQSLGKDERKARCARTRQEYFRIRPVTLAKPNHARASAEWYIAAEDSTGETSEQRLERELSRHPPPGGPLRPSRFVHSLCESIILDFWWDDCSDKDIATHFAEIVKRLRPPGHPGPLISGKNPLRTPRAQLNALGAFRLFCYSTVEGLRSRCKEGYAHYSTGLLWESSQWSRASRLVNSTFRRLLPPPLPPDRPIHSRPAKWLVGQ